MRVLVVGNASLSDLLLKTSARPGSSAVAPLLDSPGMHGVWVPGGAAATIALAIRQSGHDVFLCHPLASEPARRADLSLLAAHGIDLDLSPRVANAPGRCIIVYGDEERLAWSTPPIADVEVDADATLAGIDYVVVAPVWSRLSSCLVAAARERGIPCAMVGEFIPEAASIGWDTVVVDRGQKDAAGEIACVTLVVTDAARGATVLSGGASEHVAAETISVVDPTGAGDTFGGAFLGARLAGSTITEAARHATAMAARCCLGYGSWAAFEETAVSGQPPLAADAAPSRRDRVVGALWGTACGDAFGMPNSFLEDLAWLTEMMPGPPESPYHAGYPAGRITDDTEQALALTEALLAGFTPEIVAEKLNAWFVSVGGEASLAVGPSTKRAMLAYARGEDVRRIGRLGVTNGAAMRIAPIGVVGGLRGLSIADLIDLVEIACIPTHFTSPAIGGAGAVAAAIAAAIGGACWPDVIEAALAGATEGERRGKWIYAPGIADRIRLAIDIADRCVSAREFATTISRVVGTGEPCTESVPAAIAAAHFAKGDPAVAIELCANARGDTDTTAAMAGGICGAFSGSQKVPADWRNLVGTVNGLDVAEWTDKLERAAKR